MNYFSKATTNHDSESLLNKNKNQLIEKQILNCFTSINQFLEHEEMTDDHNVKQIKLVPTTHAFPVNSDNSDNIWKNKIKTYLLTCL